MDYKDLDDKQLGEVYHKVAVDLSYMNAAEGQSWYAEAVQRQACQKEYKEICQEYKDRGLDVPKGNYLI